MKALISGAAGFVGRHLTNHLESHGDEVIGVDRFDGPDLLDAAGWVSLVSEVRPDAVYHLGGFSDVGGSWSTPNETFRVNAEGTLNVLQACVTAGVHRVVAVDVFLPGCPPSADLIYQALVDLIEGRTPDTHLARFGR